MRKLIYIFILGFILSCSEEAKNQRPQTEQETAYTFSKFVLEQDWKKAKELMLPSRENEKAFLKLINNTAVLSQKEKEENKLSSIILDEPERINDSIVIIYFTPSVNRNKQKLKLIFNNNMWWVDLAYTESGNI